MATVYVAEDLRHHRKVAVKVLRPELAAIVGAERFLQEIEVTANLQHPNILPLYDSGEVLAPPLRNEERGSGGEVFLYYVMPFVDGESLRDKLRREKQLHVEDAVEITKSVAAALDYAHRHDVIHRDIKPENILINDGQALVADFGIALAVSQAGGERLTETGLSLGTPFYMSPEQATGDRELDARSDIYSLAAMTYEMLTGDPPHTGSTAQAIIASVVTEAPRPVTARRPTVPSRVEAAVHKALNKLPADRFATAAQFAESLGSEGAAETAASLARSMAAAPVRTRDWRLAGALTAAVGFAGVALFMALRGPGSVDRLPVGRFMVPLPVDLANTALSGSDIAVSPDGSRIVFAGRHDQGTQLYSRRLGDLNVEPIPDTDGAAQPFFSPDGRWIGFVADLSVIRKVPASGGPAVDILRFARVLIAGLHWGDDDTILFGQLGSLYRVGASGGAVDSIRLAEQQFLYWPHMLPGSEAALVTVGQSSQTARLGLLDLATGDLTILLQGASQAFYVPTGHLLYGHAQSQSLFAVPFDPITRTTLGEPAPVLGNVQVNTMSNGGNVQFAVSPAGTAVYVASQAASVAPFKVVLSNLDGDEEILDFNLGAGALRYPRFSPGSGRLAFSMPPDIYIYELDVGATSRLTFEGQNFFPIWSPDGKFIAFTSLRQGTQDFDIHRRRSDGRGVAEQLTARPLAQGPRLWLPDGRMLVVEVHPEGQYDLHILDPAGTLDAYLTNPWNEASPTLSPDFRWLAYVSDETGQDEVYVSAFPDAGGRWQVSEDGGTDPLWDEDGTIYYLHDSDLYAAQVRTSPSVTVLGRRLALQGPFVTAGRASNLDREPGGGRFALIRPAETGALPEITVVMNWFDELKARLEQ